MLRNWTVAYLAHGWVPLMDAPDAAGGGGGADPNGAGDDSQSSADGADGVAGDPGVDAAGDDAGGEESLEDLLLDDKDDDGDQARPEGERIKALAKKNRKLRRQLASKLSVLKRLDGVDLDDLIHKARTADSLTQQIQRNPKLRALLHGGDAEEDEPRTPKRAPEEAEPAFDEDALPFNPNASEANRYFADLAKNNHALQRTVKQLEARLNQIDGREVARTEADVRREWKSQMDAASEHIKDEGVRDMFRDAVTAAYQVGGKTGKVKPGQVINHYLKKLGVKPQEAQKAAAAAAGATPGAGAKPNTDAARQRIAENNKSLPRTPAPPTNSSPTAARRDRPTLQTIRMRITGAKR